MQELQPKLDSIEQSIDTLLKRQENIDSEGEKYAISLENAKIEFEKASRKVQRVEDKLNRFWGSGRPAQVLQEYNRYFEIVTNILDPKHWQALRQSDESPLLMMVMVPICMMMGIFTTWGGAKLAFGDHNYNFSRDKEERDRAALIRYEVRFVDWVKHIFDKNRLVKETGLISALSKYVNDVKFHPENSALKHASRAASAMCGWLRAAYSYAIEAEKVVDEMDELQELQELQRWREESMYYMESMCKETAKKLEEIEQEMKNFDVQKGDLLMEFEEINSILDRLNQAIGELQEAEELDEQERLKVSEEMKIVKNVDKKESNIGLDQNEHKGIVEIERREKDEKLEQKEGKGIKEEQELDQEQDQEKERERELDQAEIGVQSGIKEANSPREDAEKDADSQSLDGDSKSLPSFWMQLDDDDGNVYYWNTETNEVQWDYPHQ